MVNIDGGGKNQYVRLIHGLGDGGEFVRMGAEGLAFEDALGAAAAKVGQVPGQKEFPDGILLCQTFGQQASHVVGGALVVLPVNERNFHSRLSYAGPKAAQTVRCLRGFFYSLILFAYIPQ